MGRGQESHPRNAYFFNLLEEKGLGTSDVVKSAHVSRQYLGRVKSGQVPVSLGVLYSVASPFDENFEQVLNEWQKSRIGTSPPFPHNSRKKAS